MAQSGLIGAGLPNHTTVYSKVSSNTDLGSAESLEVRLSAPIASGGKPIWSTPSSAAATWLM